VDNIFDNEYWNEEADSLWEELAEVILGALLYGVTSGVDTLPPSTQTLVKFDDINSALIDYANRYNYSWIRDITETTRKQVQRLVSDWVASGSPLSVLEAQLEPLFGERRAEQIAITETTRIVAEGNTETWRSTGLVEQVRFNTVEDDRVCEFCSPLDGQVFDVDDYGHKPPIHVGCRCFETPVLSEEAFERQLERIYG
jgi:SPP1 gp7 family putative phage head morphogenesis protein